MHPLIRLLALLVFAAFVPWLPAPALLVAGLVLLAGTAWQAAVRRGALQGLRRVRWLLLSIAVLYLWFVPGERLLPALGTLSPTTAGLALALHHAGVLAVMVWAASAVLAVTPPEAVTAALRGLLFRPLRSDVTLRFADRVGLLLAEMPRVRERVAEDRRTEGVGFAERAAETVRAIERRSKETDLQPLAPLPLGPVPRWQWLLPAAVAGACGGFVLFM